MGAASEQGDRSRAYIKVNSLLVAIPSFLFLLPIRASPHQESTPSRSNPRGRNVFHSVLGPPDPFIHPSRRAQCPSERDWHIQIYEECSCLDRMLGESDIGSFVRQKENLREDNAYKDHRRYIEENIFSELSRETKLGQSKLGMVPGVKLLPTEQQGRGRRSQS